MVLEFDPVKKPPWESERGNPLLKKRKRKRKRETKPQDTKTSLASEAISHSSPATLEILSFIKLGMHDSPARGMAQLSPLCNILLIGIL